VSRPCAHPAGGRTRRFSKRPQGLSRSVAEVASRHVKKTHENQVCVASRRGGRPRLRRWTPSGHLAAASFDKRRGLGLEGSRRQDRRPHRQPTATAPPGVPGLYAIGRRGRPALSLAPQGVARGRPLASKHRRAEAYHTELAHPRCTYTTPADRPRFRPHRGPGQGTGHASQGRRFPSA